MTKTRTEELVEEFASRGLDPALARELIEQAVDECCEVVIGCGPFLPLVLRKSYDRVVGEIQGYFFGAGESAAHPGATEPRS